MSNPVWHQVTRAFGSSLEVVVRISVAEVHSGTLRMVPWMEKMDKDVYGSRSGDTRDIFEP